MKCSEAQARWHRRLDDGVDDAVLDVHMAGCEACRRYADRMERVVDVLDGLRNETRSVVSRRTTAGTGAVSRDPRRRHRTRVPIAIAAALALLIGGTLFWRRDRVTEKPAVVVSLQDKGPSMEDPLSEDDGIAAEQQKVEPAPEPVLGITLRGRTAREYVAFAVPSSQDNVQLYRLYLSVASRGGDAGP